MTSGSWEEILRFAEKSGVPRELMVTSVEVAVAVVVHHMAERGSLFFVATPVNYDFAKGVIAVAVGTAVAEVDASGPYSAEPIPSLH